MLSVTDLATCANRSTRASERPHFIRSADAAQPGRGVKCVARLAGEKDFHDVIAFTCVMAALRYTGVIKCTDALADSKS
jgi:hypothetical protein